MNLTVATTNLQNCIVDSMSTSNASTQWTNHTGGDTHIHYYPRSYGFWDWMCTPTYITHNHYHGGGRRDNDESNDRALYIIGAIAMGAIALTAGFYLGGDIAEYMKASDGLEYTDQVAWSGAEINTNWSAQLFTKMQNQALIRAAIKTAIVASTIICVTGCVLASSPVAIAGLMGTFLGGVGYAVHKGATWNFQEKLDEQFGELWNHIQEVRNAGGF